MIKTLTNYRHNWILVSAISCGVVFSLISLFFDTKSSTSHVGVFDRLPILLVIVVGVVVAPVLEELSFRGFFSNSNRLRIIALIGFLFYIVLSFYSKYSIGFAVLALVLALVLIMLYYKYRSSVVFILFVIFNAIVFGLIHYSIEDFSKPGFQFVLVQIGGALLLTWITMNKGLFFSMLFHGLWNLGALSIFVYSLQFVPKEINIIEKNSIKIVYQQVPIMDSNTVSVTNTADGLTAKNVTIQTFLDLGITDNSLKSAYSSIIPMARYDITVEFKDGGRNYETVLKILQEKEMIVKN